MIDWLTVFYIIGAAVLGVGSSLALSILIGKRLKKNREAWDLEEQARIDEINEQLNGGRDA